MRPTGPSRESWEMFHSVRDSFSLAGRSDRNFSSEKCTSVASHAFLAEDDALAAFQIDREGAEQHQRREDEQGQAAEHHVQEALQSPGGTAVRGSVQANQRRVPDELDIIGHVVHLGQTRDDEDVTAVPVAGTDQVDQLAVRQAAPGQDEGPWAVLVQQPQQIVRLAEDRGRQRVGGLHWPVQKAQRCESVVRVVDQPLGYFLTGSVGPHHDRGVRHHTLAAEQPNDLVVDTPDGQQRHAGNGRHPKATRFADDHLSDHEKQRQGGEPPSEQPRQVVEQRQDQTRPVEARPGQQREQQQRERHGQSRSTWCKQAGDDAGEQVAAQEKRTYPVAKQRSPPGAPVRSLPSCCRSESAPG